MIEERIEYFTNNRGQKLEARLYGTGEKAIIVCHGFGGNKDAPNKVAWARGLAEAGYFVVTFDLSGHGKSQGLFEEFTYSQGINDLENAIALAKKLGAKRIGLLGHSMGAVISALEASINWNITAAALLSGFHTPTIVPEVFGANTKGWETRWFTEFVDDGKKMRLQYSFRKDQLKHDVLASLKKIGCPVLIAHGGKDDRVPLREAEDMARMPKNCEFKVFPELAHDLGQPEVALLVVDFFKKNF
jgi:pimeloyl-ACP methyl ester carboxylesterase